MSTVSDKSKPSRLLRLPEVMLRVGLSKAVIYKRQSEGGFPSSVSIGVRSSAWLEEEVEQWIRARVSDRDHDSRKAKKLKDHQNA